MSLKRNILSLHRLINFERSFSLWQGLKSEADFEEVKELKYKRVLILAPHADDEVLGCGGIIKRFGAAVGFDVLYLFCGDEYFDSDISRRRRDEAERIKPMLGISQQYFNMAENGSSLEAKELTKLVDFSQYQAIFCPDPADPHPDHRESARMLAEIIKKHKLSSNIWLYGVWNPLPYFNRLVVIDGKAKEAAMNTYQSQMKDRDYVGAISGLNAYRAKIYGVGEAAEAFMAMPAVIYAKIYK